MEAVAQKGVSIALACRTFGVSERCYRHEPKLKSENERIGALLIGLTRAHRTWGFGLCDLPLSFHPAAFRVFACCMPGWAG